MACVQPVAPPAEESDGDSDEESSSKSSSSDDEEVTIGDMILALKEAEGEETIEEPMSDEPGLSDDGA